MSGRTGAMSGERIPSAAAGARGWSRRADTQAKRCRPSRWCPGVNPRA